VGREVIEIAFHTRESMSKWVRRHMVSSPDYRFGKATTQNAMIVVKERRLLAWLADEDVKGATLTVAC
jgi:hypothetical protein